MSNLIQFDSFKRKGYFKANEPIHFEIDDLLMSGINLLRTFKRDYSPDPSYMIQRTIGEAVFCSNVLDDDGLFNFKERYDFEIGQTPNFPILYCLRTEHVEYINHLIKDYDVVDNSTLFSNIIKTYLQEFLNYFNNQGTIFSFPKKKYVQLDAMQKNENLDNKLLQVMYHCKSKDCNLTIDGIEDQNLNDWKVIFYKEKT